LVLLEFACPLRSLARSSSTFSLNGTAGDNVFNVDFFRRVLAEFYAHPEAAAVAVDFWCHYIGRSVRTRYETHRFDLSTALFKASYLDSRNAAFRVELNQSGTANNKLQYRVAIDASDCSHDGGCS